MNGKNLARVLRRVPISYIVVEMNPEIVRTESREGTHILYGDAANQQILERAGVRRARVLVLAISDPSVTRHATDTAHRLNPALHIIIRTRYVKEMESLFALGGNDVVPEEFETSIEIFSRVLRRYMVPKDIVERSVREIRQDGYEMFRGLRERHRPARTSGGSWPAWRWKSTAWRRAPHWQGARLPKQTCEASRARWCWRSRPTSRCSQIPIREPSFRRAM